MRVFRSHIGLLIVIGIILFICYHLAIRWLLMDQLQDGSRMHDMVRDVADYYQVNEYIPESWMDIVSWRGKKGLPPSYDLKWLRNNFVLESNQQTGVYILVLNDQWKKKYQQSLNDTLHALIQMNDDLPVSHSNDTERATSRSKYIDLNEGP